MRAVVVEEPGGPEVLRVRETADPVPGPGEIAVDVAASGVNFIDVYHRSGLYPLPAPFTPGMEGAGTVSALGAGVSGLAVGDRVGWVMLPGSYAERAVIPADRAVPLPDGVSTELAAAALLQGMTAHFLTRTAHTVREGDDVLVHAAAGGMGLLLTQLVKLHGGRVIGTVSTAEKEAVARAAGADEVIRYTEEPVDTAVRKLTGGAGVAVVYDGVGAATFDASLASLRPRGLLAVFGQASGVVPPVELQRLNAAGSVFLTRPTLAHYIADRAELLTRSRELFEWIRAGRLDVRVNARYPLADAGRAHEDLTGRRTTGKSILLVR
ncbi:quinone oxidoreductase family protein [Allonocardiopsis opalescens]|uniref:NADPH2:quinone reductase n=1 Tax=Allonocardiopsis opalescens TaxID=1144618 RepID=A0A2T0Q0C9_9ACTN|nr:quinone oxidoreductase [Allonocardiopsis opalescens]PRX97240.1 NADPH2:quinone reductase [Allonocardiopsis opalescens]